MRTLGSMILHRCRLRETLENPGPLRDNGAVIAGQD
jgi:hypothetical protein